MPYIRDRSPFYQVRRRNLVGVGDTGVISTRTEDKALAERMERALVDTAERALYEPSYRAVVDAVLDRRLALPDLLSAVSRGAVGALRTALVDPPLAEAAARYVQRGEGKKKGRGRQAAVDVLLALAPARARLSWLRDRKNVEAVLYAAERGEPADADGQLTPRKRNSVRRTVYRAVSLVLRAECGQAERDRVLSEVDFPGEDDTREVALSAADVGRLLDACASLHAKNPRSGYDHLGVAVRLMLQTSADRGTLFHGKTASGTAPGLRVDQVRIYAEDTDGGEVYTGEVFLRDTKTAARSRTVPVPDGMCRALIPLVVDKGPSDQVFRLGYSQVDVRWGRVRTEAGLDGLRLKDLRAQTAIAAERAGVPQTVVVATMGHSDEAMTRRYQKHRATMSGAHAEAIERQLGLTGS